MKNYTSLMECIEENFNVKMFIPPRESEQNLFFADLSDIADKKQKFIEEALENLAIEASTSYEHFIFNLKKKEKLNKVEPLIIEYYSSKGFILRDKFHKDQHSYYNSYDYNFERENGDQINLNLELLNIRKSSLNEISIFVKDIKFREEESKV